MSVHIQKHYFYGQPVIRREEQEYIQQILAKYKNEPVNDELKKKIWDELQNGKFLGKITIPFKVALRLDSSGKFPNYVEIILDTKV